MENLKMMNDLSNKTALVWDSNNGLFLPVAHCLAKDFGRVMYFSEWQDGSPRIGKRMIGDGFDDIIRVKSAWGVKKEVDLFVFPDVQRYGEQWELESQGFAVWGSRGADSLELNREKFLSVLKDTGLEVPPHDAIEGLTRLAQFLKDKTDVYIKVSMFRGSFETFHWRSWDEDRFTLDSWAVEFGPTKDMIRFLVFPPIGDKIEIGGDTYCVDGEWPSLMLHGHEDKDKSYIGAVTKRADMPQPIQDVLEAFSPILKENRYRNQWSMELRTDGDKWFFIDATCRGGLPSTASQLETWKNFSEIVWNGAHGDLIDPIPRYDFSVEVALSLKGEKDSWRVSDIQDANLRHCCEIDGLKSFPPDDQPEEHIGWIQAGGDTIEDAIDAVKAKADKLPMGVSADTESLVKLLGEIKESEEAGIEFSSQTVPEPHTVITNA